jgi:hypothetical protein
LIALLSEYQGSDKSFVSEFHITLFFIASVLLPNEGVQSRMIDAADKAIFLPAGKIKLLLLIFIMYFIDLNTCVQALRRSQLDILIYPEIGIDPVTYFLAYTRVAPVQAAWLGHPDTSGIPTINYFLTSKLEQSDYSSRYSESVFTMHGLGNYF